MGPHIQKLKDFECLRKIWDDGLELNQNKHMC